MKVKRRIKNYLFGKLSLYYLISRRLKLQYYQFLYPGILNVSFPLAIGSYFKLSVFEIGSCKININANVEFRNYCNLLLMGNGELNIQSDVFFNNFCCISCLGKIDIGAYTMFGEGVKIYDHNHLSSYDNAGILQIERQRFSIGSVRIGNNCWIGSNVTILNNVDIGDNVIIGANCLIYKSVPSNTIVKHKEELIIKNNFTEY